MHNKFSGHPKGQCRALRRGLGTPGNCPAFHPSYAHIKFATESSAQAAAGLDKSIFQGQIIKVREPHKLPGHLVVEALGCMDLL